MMQCKQDNSLRCL